MRILDGDPYGAGSGSDEARPITPTVLKRSEESLFFPPRQRLRRYADADANVGVGEAEVQGNVILLPFFNPSLPRHHANNLAEFTTSRYETAHRPDVKMVIARV